MGITPNDINEIFKVMLMEFPIDMINIKLPAWLECLEYSHWLKKQLTDSVVETFAEVKSMRNIEDKIQGMAQIENVADATIMEINICSV